MKTFMDKLRESIEAYPPIAPSLLEEMEALQERFNHRKGIEGITLLKKGAVGVITSHQPLLAGGPLFVLAKAVTAIAWSRYLNHQGISSVPIFWVHSFDRDWQEIQQFSWWQGRQWQTFRLPQPASHGPVGMESLKPYQDLLTLPTETLRTIYSQAETFSEAFARLLAYYFKDTELIIFLPEGKGYQGLLHEHFQDIQTHWQDIFRLLATHRHTLEKPRLNLKEELLPIYDKKGRFIRVDEPLPDEAFPNVYLRPFLQNLLLRGILQVAGPNEREYLKEVKPLYHWKNLPPALVLLRATLKIILPPYATFMKAFFENPSLNPRDLFFQSIDFPPYKKMEKLKKTLFAELHNQEQSLPDQENFFKSLKKKMEGGFGKWEAQLLGEAKKRYPEVWEEVKTAYALAFPCHKPQERIALFAQWIPPSWVPELIKKVKKALPNTADIVLELPSPET